MTAQEVIATIRAEIERRIEAHHTHNHFCAEHEFRNVLSFLSDLEKSEKPINPEVNFENEIEMFGTNAPQKTI